MWMRHRVGNVLKDQADCERIGTSPHNSMECGLSSYVPHERIEAILKRETRGDVRCKLLLEAAYDAGGEDNVTVLLALFHAPN
jgi:hypothetical protein